MSTKVTFGGEGGGLSAFDGGAGCGCAAASESVSIHSVTTTAAGLEFMRACPGENLVRGNLTTRGRVWARRRVIGHAVERRAARPSSRAGAARSPPTNVDPQEQS